MPQPLQIYKTSLMFLRGQYVLKEIFIRTSNTDNFWNLNIWKSRPLYWAIGQMFHFLLVKKGFELHSITFHVYHWLQDHKRLAHVEIFLMCASLACFVQTTTSKLQKETQKTTCWWHIQVDSIIASFSTGLRVEQFVKEQRKINCFQIDTKSHHSLYTFVLFNVFLNC